MKQSSIEWLAYEINVHLNFDQRLYLKELLEQAKAMHRGEIEYANYYGQSLHAKYTTDLMMRENAEYYYEETFNTKDK